MPLWATTGSDPQKRTSSAIAWASPRADLISSSLTSGRRAVSISPSGPATSVWNVARGRPGTRRQAPISVIWKSGASKSKPVVSKSITAKEPGAPPAASTPALRPRSITAKEPGAPPSAGIPALRPRLRACA